MRKGITDLFQSNVKLCMLIVALGQWFESENSRIDTVGITQVGREVDSEFGRFVVCERVGRGASFELQLAASMKHANNDLVHSMHEGFVPVVALLEPSGNVDEGCAHL